MPNFSSKLGVGLSPKNMSHDFRGMIFYRFSIITTLVLTPFVVYTLVQGLWLMGISGFLVLVILVLDAIYVYRGKKPPVPPVVVFLPMILTIVVSVPKLGFAALLWIYPALVMSYIILSKRVANIVSGIMLVAVIPTAMNWLSLEISIRLVVTLSLTITFVNIFSSELTRIQRKLSELATVDPLTGTYNRRHLEERSDEMIRLRQSKSQSASMLLIDVDHFKGINDKYGHDIGDFVLQELVAKIRVQLRNGDEVFRLGGEEFVILLPSASQGVAVELAEKIRRGVPDIQVQGSDAVTVSIGVAELSHQESASNWLKRCDDALYRAKNEGRNRVVSSEAVK
jgi:diguanylate cyclase (GGDEF)-like protein